MNVLLGVVLAVGVVVAAFAVLVGRLLFAARVSSFDPEALRHFSTDRYQPMLRLLSREDVLFLRDQPGYDPRIERDLMRARRRAFRFYLRAMAHDFDRLHRALRLVILHAPEDRSEVAVLIVKQKALFFTGLAFAHIRLTMHALGIGTVDVTNLIAALDSMRVEFKNLAPATQVAV